MVQNESVSMKERGDERLFCKPATVSRQLKQETGSAMKQIFFLYNTASIHGSACVRGNKNDSKIRNPLL